MITLAVPLIVINPSVYFVSQRNLNVVVQAFNPQSHEVKTVTYPE